MSSVTVIYAVCYCCLSLNKRTLWNFFLIRYCIRFGMWAHSEMASFYCIRKLFLFTIWNNWNSTWIQSHAKYTNFKQIYNWNSKKHMEKNQYITIRPQICSVIVAFILSPLQWFQPEDTRFHWNCFFYRVYTYKGHPRFIWFFLKQWKFFRYFWR